MAKADPAITAIPMLRHDTVFGGKREALVENMVAQNMAVVDAMTGAPVSSWLIHSAVRDALVKGLN